MFEFVRQVFWRAVVLFVGAGDELSGFCYFIVSNDEFVNSVLFLTYNLEAWNVGVRAIFFEQCSLVDVDLSNLECHALVLVLASSVRLLLKS